MHLYYSYFLNNNLKNNTIVLETAHIGEIQITSPFHTFMKIIHVWD